MTMTRDEFDSHVLTVFSSAMEWRGEDSIWWPHGSQEEYRVTWVQGGRSGGNCWGDSADYDLDAEPEPGLDVFDKFLEDVTPGITMKAYKQLVAEVVHTDTKYENEYYGNYTIYGVKTIQFDHVYTTLVHMGLI